MLPFTWLAFQVWFVCVSPGFVHSDNSSKKVFIFPLVLVQQGLYDCIAMPLLYLRKFVEFPTQTVVQNVEHTFVT